MKYYRAKVKLKRKERKDLEKQLTALDKVLLKKCEGRGTDIIGLIGAGKPFVNQFGTKQFATTPQVVHHTSKLVKMGLLERR